jgi:transcriptional regulator with XRE-family HTH domain
VLPCWATRGYALQVTEVRSAASLLRELRRKQGKSLRAAAEDLGVAPSHLSRLERGEKTASPQLARKAAEYYGVQPDRVDLAEGRVPRDIVAILRAHPELLDRLRAEYGSSTGDSE